MKKFFAALFVALVFATLAFAAPAPMQPGEWLVTTRVEMPGMPVAIPPQTHTYCYTEQQIKEKKVMPKYPDNCKEQYARVSGNTMSWKVVCNGKGGTMTMTGTMTSTGTSYTGKSITQMPGGRKMTSDMSGKRTGPCK